MDEAPWAALSEQVGLVPWLSEAVDDSLLSDGSILISARSGQLPELYPDLAFRLPDGDDLAVIGSSCDGDRDLALRKAVFETLERYASAVYSPDEVVTASLRALGAEAMPGLPLPDLMVRDDPGAPWRARGQDADAAIRWVRGYHLLERREVFVPLVMAHIFVAGSPEEDFHIQNTAGVAAHASLEQALLSAIRELVERDAVETVWATRAPLKEIRVDRPVDSELRALLWADERDGVDQRYYDATRDLGLPTVYAVRRLAPPIGRDVIVSCATAHGMEAAMLKARREAAGQQLMRQTEAEGQIYSRFPGEPGRLVADFVPSRPDLSFLDQTGHRNLSHFVDRVASIPAQLSETVERLRSDHPDIVAVTLTTDDLRSLGVHVVRAIIPTLMSLSPSANQKVMRHSRLDQIARHFGRPEPDLGTINTAIQPFR